MKKVYQLLLVSVILLLIQSGSLFSQTCSGSDIIIPSGPSVIWDLNTKPAVYTINQNVCIENGASLIIDGITVKMDAFINITVHKGGTLTVKNAVLSPTALYNQWQGIYVMGDSDEPLCDEVNQTLNTVHHGKAHLENSLIEKSNYGIRLIGYGTDRTSAGIISVNNCTFLDNYTAGIYMEPYYISGSNCAVNSVANSTFIATSSTISPIAFIYMESYRWFTVLGCTFEVQMPLKKHTVGIMLTERFHHDAGQKVYDYVQAGKLVLEESEYVDPYNYQFSAKHTTPKRNQFSNLAKGIYFGGAEEIISPFESYVKGCDFDRVKIGIEIRHAQSVNVLCNKYIAKKYDDNTPFQIQYDEKEENGNGGYIGINTNQTPPNPISCFAYCFTVYGEVNFMNNYCEWDADFTAKEAIGVAFNGQADETFPARYIMSGNTFKYTGTEGNKVTGLFYHGQFTHDPQIIANTFDKLYRDIHLKGVIRPFGGTCFYPVLAPQGERFDPVSQTVYTVGNGNVFSNPAIDAQGNIYGDAADVFYISPVTPPPNFDPDQRTACVTVATAGTPVNMGPLPVDCSIPPVSGLLSDGIQNQTTDGTCMQLTPNPAYNIVTIDLQGIKQAKWQHGLEINIYNSLGSLVLFQTIDEDLSFIQLNTSNLSNGLYFVKLLQEGKTLCTQKLIKQ